MTRQRCLLEVSPDRAPRQRRKSTAPKGDRTVTAYIGRRTCWLTGAGVVELLDRVGSPRQWDHLRRQWMCPVDRASDVLALAEHGNRQPTVVEAVDR